MEEVFIRYGAFIRGAFITKFVLRGGGGGIRYKALMRQWAAVY